MVCSRFALVLILLGFLFATTALRNSAPTHDHHLGQDRDEDEAAVMRYAFWQTQMDSINGGKPANLRKLMLGGKSMSAQKSSNADTEEENIGMKSTVTQKTPVGEACEYDQRSSSCPVHATIKSRKHGKHGKHLETMSAKGSLNLKKISTSRKSGHRKDEVNQIVSTPTSEKDESDQKLLKAAQEIVSLMHRDYKGMGSRKPPVHNNQPRD